MTEAQYLEGVYPLIRKIARRLARFNHEDLAQVGMLAVLEMFRKQEHPPATALTACVARRAIIHQIRSETCMRRGGEFERANPTDITGETGAEERRIGRIDLERALALLDTPQEREVFRQTLAGRTLDEIGRSIGKPLQGVQYIKQQAIARIRRRLDIAA